MAQVEYPDSTGGNDVVTFAYNRQGERTTATDQRGCVHTYDRDLLGRLAQDRVTTLGTGVDGAVRRLSATFDVRGLPSLLTSHDNPTVGSGSTVNQVQFAYNDFAQLIQDYQSHSGAVNTSTTPKVQYAYANGSANTIRPTSFVYPDGRTLTYSYGSTDGIDDACSRIVAIIDDDNTHLADYSHLGLGTVVVVDYTEPDVKYTLVDLSGTNDPDTGDIYSGLDRFGRVKDCRWYDYGSSADVARLKCGYDRATNRLWREDTVATSLSKNFDELYAYDGLHRVTDLQRGILNGSHTSISSKTFAQSWALDSTGNWNDFEEAATGGSLTLDQSRSANAVNEITGVTNSIGSAWADPANDLAGNMTTIPQPGDPTESFSGTFDAWNRLVKLADDSSSDTVQENEYNAQGCRTVRKIYSAGVLSETRHLYYTPAWRCVEERVGSATSADRQFVWGLRYIDDLIARDRGAERRYALQDANWNVVAIADDTGTVQQRYSYTAYGRPTELSSAFVATGNTPSFDILFAGYRFDALVQLYDARCRMLHPVLGTWLTRDPLGYGYDVSLYGYVKQSPVTWVDPYGLIGIIGEILILIGLAGPAPAAASAAPTAIVIVVESTIAAAPAVAPIAVPAAAPAAAAGAGGVVAAVAGGGTVALIGTALIPGVAAGYALDYYVTGDILRPIYADVFDWLYRDPSWDKPIANNPQCPTSPVPGPKVKQEPPKKCKPCIPPVGTVAYELHVPQSAPHQGMTHHYHWFKMNQSPPKAGCICFWKRNVIPPTDMSGGMVYPKAVPVTKAGGGGVA